VRILPPVDFVLEIRIDAWCAAHK